MFRQPTLQKNALHEYLDSEDHASATTNTNTAIAGGAYAAAGGSGGQGGWGETKSGGEEQEEGEDEEMTVGLECRSKLYLVVFSGSRVF